MPPSGMAFGIDMELEVGEEWTTRARAQRRLGLARLLAAAVLGGDEGWREPAAGVAAVRRRRIRCRSRSHCWTSLADPASLAWRRASASRCRANPGFSRALAIR